MIVIAAGLLNCGCEQQKKPLDMQQCIEEFEAFGPDTLTIVGLTELKGTAQGEEAPKLKVFVKVLDSFGSAIKAPCVFRVELYEYVERSPSPRGKRIEIWPDVDLTEAGRTNAQWRDYLRAYEFNLDVGPKLDLGRVYIVEVTCLLPTGKRLYVQHNLKYQQ
jgi:hypothetical protein